jgi:hypothetical protein
VEGPSTNWGLEKIYKRGARNRGVNIDRRFEAGGSVVSDFACHKKSLVFM